MLALESTLAGLKESGAFRELTLNPAGLDFSSNDYLGFAAEPRLKSALLERLQNEERWGAPSSRLLRGHTPVHARTEARLAALAGWESALLFSAGYLANLAVLTALGGTQSEFFSDALNHASLVDGMRLAAGTKKIFAHNDLTDLEEKLAASSGKRKVIVTESVFSMDGDLAPLPELLKLAARYGAWLVVDEAHATGVFGAGLLKDPAGVPVIAVHTGGKALGAMGAFVLCSAKVRELLVNQARSFIYTTALSPIICLQLELAATLAHDEPARGARCLANADFLRARLAPSLVPKENASQIIPVRVPGNREALRAAARLQENGFDVRAIRAPTVPKGAERLRISVKSFHERPELERLAAQLNQEIGA